MIIQSEAPAPEVIVVDKLCTYLSVNSGITRETRAIVTPEKCISGKKIYITSLATSPSRIDPILNQDKKTLEIQKDKFLPPHLPPFPPGFKSLRNEANDDDPGTTDTSCTDKDDTPCTNWDDYIENVKAMKNTNDDDEYK